MGRHASLAQGQPHHSGLTIGVGGDASALARIDAIAAALVERSAPVTFRVATTAAEIAIAQRLRGSAMVDQGWVQSEELADGRDEDVDDGRATHILASLDGAIIGTCRLIYPEPGCLLPMEKVPDARRVPAAAVEVGRVVVLHPLARRHGSVMAALIAAAWLELRANGYRRICGTVSAGILRLYRRVGFLVRVVGPPVDMFGEVRYPILFEPNEAAAAMAAGRHR